MIYGKSEHHSKNSDEFHIEITIYYSANDMRFAAPIKTERRASPVVNVVEVPRTVVR